MSFRQHNWQVIREQTVDLNINFSSIPQISQQKMTQGRKLGTWGFLGPGIQT